jgi:dihydrofolate synthase/folylpolyglutamate synthase
MTAREFLFSLEVVGIKLGLDQIRRLVDRLGRPDRTFPSVTVAGTNGKGSVTAMIERGLRAAGYRTGRYTSPHLIKLEERFTIDGADVASGAVDGAAGRIRELSGELPFPPTFFEATTAMALDLFREARVEVAVLEVGLGGRLDATNVVEARAVAITAVDFDHEQFLGNTIEAIAREKAGVIKPGSTVVLAENPPAVEQVVADACRAAGAHFVPARTTRVGEPSLVEGRARVSVETPHARYEGLTLGLRGAHQIQNAVAAVRLLEELSASGAFDIPASAIRTAVEDVVWPARLELAVIHGHQVLIDGAHNPAGARALAAYVRDTYGRPLPMVVGLMRDKKIDAVLAALSASASHFVFTAPVSARAATPAELAERAAVVARAVPAETCDRADAAVRRAATLGSPVVVAGSLYLAGEIRATLP